MCTRPGFGLFIAYFLIALYSILVITLIALLANKKIINDIVNQEAAKNPNFGGIAWFLFFLVEKKSSVIFSLIVCAIVITTSGVLARGIIKRRHRYMAPWLVLYGITIACFFIYNFVILFKFKNSAGEFATGICNTIVHCLIFYPIYSLYRDVRIENKIIERTRRTV